MRAIRVPEHGDASVLTVADVPAPTADETEVRIDVAAAGVNFADIAKRRGTYPDGPTPPYTPGIEVAGRVTSAGDRTAFEPGEAVMAYTRRGGYAETVAVDVDRVFRIPEGCSLTEAAAIPIQWLTAHNVCFEWGGLEADDHVLIQAGAGGVGSAAVQLAAARGATVTALASTAAKRDFARSLGATHTLAYDDDIKATLERRIDRDSGKRDGDSSEQDGDSGKRDGDSSEWDGVDLVLDSVGGDVFRACLEALAPGGRIVTFGLASGDAPSVSTPRLFFENRSVVGYHLGNAVRHQPDRVFGALEPLRSLLSAGDVEVVVDRTFPLADAASAHEYLEDRRTRGKVLLEP